MCTSASECNQDKTQWTKDLIPVPLHHVGLVRCPVSLGYWGFLNRVWRVSLNFGHQKKQEIITCAAVKWDVSPMRGTEIGPKSAGLLLGWKCSSKPAQCLNLVDMRVTFVCWGKNLNLSFKLLQDMLLISLEFFWLFSVKGNVWSFEVGLYDSIAPVQISYFIILLWVHSTAALTNCFV